MAHPHGRRGKQGRQQVIKMAGLVSMVDEYWALNFNLVNAVSTMTIFTSRSPWDPDTVYTEIEIILCFPYRQFSFRQFHCGHIIGCSSSLSYITYVHFCSGVNAYFVSVPCEIQNPSV